jgi:hypothetical protein
MMRIIAHRGLLDGPDPIKENYPDQIRHAIKEGYDVEIDLRVIDDECWLGHDEPQYKVSLDWLKRYDMHLWIHCKNLEALEFCFDHPTLNYFAHDCDDYVVTSKGYVWAYPGKPGGKYTILVMPEYKGKLESIIEDYNNDSIRIYGVCTDFAAKVRHETKRNTSW